MPVRDSWGREEPKVVDEATVGRVAKSRKTMSPVDESSSAASMASNSASAALLGQRATR